MVQYGIALVRNTRDAMAAEKAAKSQGLDVRIIATPSSLKATCGFCLKYNLAQEAAIQHVLRASQWPTEGWYHASQEGLRVTYDRIEEDC